MNLFGLNLWSSSKILLLDGSISVFLDRKSKPRFDIMSTSVHEIREPYSRMPKKSELQLASDETAT